MNLSDFQILNDRVKGNKQKPKLKKKYRSKTEELYANQLQARKLAGEIADWFYEPITFKLAEGLRYTIDFLVFQDKHCGTMEFIEIKGGNPTRSGINKFKQVRTNMPFFKFRMMVYSKGNWTEKYPE